MDFQEHREVRNSPQQNEPPWYKSATEESSLDIQFILARLGLLEVPKLVGTSVEQLINALQDEHWETRASAATALGDIETPVPIDPLITALKKDEHESVRSAAARALGNLRKGVPITILIKALHDSSPLVREAAITALGKIGIATSIEPLVTALKDEDASVRAATTYAIGKLGKNIPISTLTEGLHDPCPLVREATATALGDLANTDARLILLAHLQEENALVREAIAQSLMRLETDITQEFIHIIINMEYTSTQEIEKQAIKALIDLGLDIHQEIASVAPLAVALQSVNKAVQKAVTTYLIGRAFDTLSKKIALAPSLELLQQEQLDPITLAGVWQTLSALADNARQDKRKIQVLISALHDQDNTVQGEVYNAIQWLIDIAIALLQERTSADLLDKVLKNKDEEQRSNIIHSLIGQGLDALEERETLELIFNGLCDPNVQKKAQAGQLLCKRAKKAYMARIPGVSLNISLNDALRLTSVKLQLGSTEEKGLQDGRTIFPWYGPAPIANEFAKTFSALKTKPVNKTASNWT